MVSEALSLARLVRMAKRKTCPWAKASDAFPQTLGRFFGSQALALPPQRCGQPLRGASSTGTPLGIPDSRRGFSLLGWKPPACTGCSGAPALLSLPWERQEVAGGDSGAEFTGPGKEKGVPGLFVEGLITKRMVILL